MIKIIGLFFLALLGTIYSVGYYEKIFIFGFNKVDILYFFPLVFLSLLGSYLIEKKIKLRSFLFCLGFFLLQITIFLSLALLGILFGYALIAVTISLNVYAIYAKRALFPPEKDKINPYTTSDGDE